MSRGKKKFKRRSNSCLRAHYTEYRTSDRVTKNKIRRSIKRVYGLVLARLRIKPDIRSKGKIKEVVTETVKNHKNDLGCFLKVNILNGLARLADR